MSKIAIVFWSGTGSTEAMANYIAEGVRAAGGEADRPSMGPAVDPPRSVRTNPFGTPGLRLYDYLCVPEGYQSFLLKKRGDECNI